MKRRKFMQLVGAGLLLGGKAMAQAQQRAVPIVGFLGNTSAISWAHLVSAFHREPAREIP